MKKWRCKTCGGTSYTGEYCLNCDDGILNFSKRRGVLQVYALGVTLVVVGGILMLSHFSVGWIIWGIGIACLFAVGVAPFTWGKKLARRLFELKEE